MRRGWIEKVMCTWLEDMEQESMMQQDDNPDVPDWILNRQSLLWNNDYLKYIVLPKLNLRPGARILDVGCGYGGLTLSLAVLQSTAYFTGVDIDSQVLEGAQRLASQAGLENVGFLRGDVRRLSFEDSHFDAVVCQALLVHVHDAAGAMREILRVLKPGGIFMAAEPCQSTTGTIAYNRDLKYDVAREVEKVRLLKLHWQGYRRLGRGDADVGTRVPMLAQELGFDLLDVRTSDMCLHAVPPYLNDVSHTYLEVRREGITNGSPTQEEVTYTSSLILAGGGTHEDVERYLRLIVWPQDTLQKVAAAMAENRFAEVVLRPLILTFARKPGCAR